MDLYQKDKNDSKYQELLEVYKNTLKKQKLLPIESSFESIEDRIEKK